MAVEDDSTACRVCRLVLNRYTDARGGAVEYRHSRPWVDHDHDPDPVPADSVDALLSCDFCPTNAPAVWNYHGEEIRDFLDAQGRRNNFSANWTACRRCDELLQAGDLNALVQRVFKLAQRRGGPIPTTRLAERADWVLRLWRTFLPTVHNRTPIVTKAPPPPPEASVLTPQKLPKIREAAARYWRDRMPVLLTKVNRHRPSTDTIAVPGADLGRDGFAYEMPTLTSEQAEAFSRRIAFALDVATLYWVSAEFTDLAVAAAADLPDVTVAEADLPARHGLLVWARPVLTVPDPIGDVVAVSWATVPDGVWMVGYTQAEVAIGRIRPGRELDLQLLREQVGWLIPTAPAGGAQFDHPVPLDSDDYALALLGILSATWLLTAQDGIAEQSVVEPDRRERKAHARKHPGTAPPTVRLVDLRRRPQAAAAAGPAGARAARVYTVRWLVRGFWKDQPYGPKRSLRKRIYIAPHLAGPDGKPLKPTTPVVRVLR